MIQRTGSGWEFVQKRKPLQQEPGREQACGGGRGNGLMGFPGYSNKPPRTWHLENNIRISFYSPEVKLPV